MQDGENNASLPAVLADICNDLWLSPMVCQGFVYDEFTGVASFLGQDKTQLIYLSKQPQTCNRPGSSLWLLNAGMSNRILVFSCCHSAEFSVAHSSRIPQGSRLSMPILTNLPQMTLLQHNMSTVQSQAVKVVCYTSGALQLFLKLEPRCQTPGNPPPLQAIKDPMLHLMLVRQPVMLSLKEQCATSMCICLFPSFTQFQMLCLPH